MSLQSWAKKLITTQVATSILQHLPEPSRDWKQGRIKGKENTIQLPAVATHQDSFHCSLPLLWLNPGLSIRHHPLLFICLFTEEFIILWSRKNLKWFLSKIKKQFNKKKNNSKKLYNHKQKYTKKYIKATRHKNIQIKTKVSALVYIKFPLGLPLKANFRNG